MCAFWAHAWLADANTVETRGTSQTPSSSAVSGLLCARSRPRPCQACCSCGAAFWRCCALQMLGQLSVSGDRRCKVEVTDVGVNTEVLAIPTHLLMGFRFGCRLAGAAAGLPPTLLQHEPLGQLDIAGQQPSESSSWRAFRLIDLVIDFPGLMSSSPAPPTNLPAQHHQRSCRQEAALMQTV